MITRRARFIGTDGKSCDIADTLKSGFGIGVRTPILRMNNDQRHYAAQRKVRHIGKEVQRVGALSNPHLRLYYSILNEI
jgi:hypothetical protein